MNLKTFLSSMNNGGDCYINYTSPVSKKFKYHVGTINFSKDTSPYIYKKYMANAGKLPRTSDTEVLVFCYDLDNFKVINLSDVNSVVPLNQTIRQDV